MKENKITKKKYLYQNKKSCNLIRYRINILPSVWMNYFRFVFVCVGICLSWLQNKIIKLINHSLEKNGGKKIIVLSFAAKSINDRNKKKKN